MSEYIAELNGGDFQTEVLDADKPVLVDFWAPWCGPCKMLAPVLEEVAQSYSDKLKIVKVNVDDNSSIAGSYSIMSIPTMILFKDGEPVERFSGYMPAADLEKKLEEAL